jgi:tetratricopeptide (TPR) repeat protein
MRWLFIAILALPMASALSAVDVLSAWDFARPEVSEARFRELARGASPDDAAILQTQVARTYGLRRRFEEARGILAPLAPELAARSAEVRVRYHLEYGRTWVSATHRADEKTPEARAAARTAFEKAHALASDSGLDDLAIDALHMMPFVETDEAAGLAWNRKALALMAQSRQPQALRWESALRNNTGLSLHRLGRYDEALSMFEANVAVNERAGDAARTRIAHWMVAWTLRAMGRLDEALAIQLRLERENDAAGKPDPHVYDELAKLYAARADPAKAAHYENLKTRTPGAPG